MRILGHPGQFPQAYRACSLLAAGRPHEVLLLSGTGHHAIGGPVTEQLLTHQLRFLQRHLGPLLVPGPA